MTVLRWNRLRRNKHWLLFVAILALIIAQPLVAHESRVATLAFDLLFVAVSVGVLLVVFDANWERLVAVVLALPAIGLTFVRLLAQAPGSAYAAIYHLSVALFLGFALVTIVRDIFHHRTISVDAVIGSFAGYLLLGVVWGSIYAASEMLAPGLFAVSPDIAWQLDDWHLRRALFNYFSFNTMAGLGYSDITAVAPLANTLTWTEVMAAQFYLAIVIAQIVGLKLASPAAKQSSANDD